VTENRLDTSECRAVSSFDEYAKGFCMLHLPGLIRSSSTPSLQLTDMPGVLAGQRWLVVGS
jgi:hypothetical protein